MNGTKALLSGSLALVALLAYQMSSDILVKASLYGIQNYQGYAATLGLAVSAGIGSIIALALSINFIEKWITQDKNQDQITQAEMDTW